MLELKLVRTQRAYSSASVWQLTGHCTAELPRSSPLLAASLRTLRFNFLGSDFRLLPSKQFLDYQPMNRRQL
jgi:hypothetical protein